MKKLFFIFAMSLMTFIGFAQSNHSNQTVEATPFFENTYVRIQGGTFMPLTEGISGTTGIAGLELGKNITPIFGVSVEGWMNFSNQYGGTAIDFSNIVGNLKINLSNAIGGYKGQPRLVEVSLVPGIGWGHYYTRDPYVSQVDRNFVTYNTFAQVDFNLGKKKQFQINANPGMMWLAGNANFSNYGKVNFDLNRSSFVCKVGFTYKFGRKGSHNFRVCNHTITQAEYDKLMSMYEMECKKPPVVKTEVKEKYVVKEVPVAASLPTLHLTFKINSSELSDVEMIKLEEYVEKLPKDAVVTVVGGADLGTGSRATNERLAKERADKVVNYLKKHNVKVQTDVKFDATRLPAASRAAIVVVK